MGLICYSLPMRPKLKITGPGTQEGLRAAYNEETNLKHRKKLQAIRLGFSGNHTTEEIADIVGCSKGSVTNWVRDYRAGGIGELLKNNYGTGRPASLNDTVCEGLLQGLKEGKWKRTKEIRKWLKETHKIELSYGGMQYWLGKLGASLKVPRKTHAKKDEGRPLEFKEGLADMLSELGLDRDKPFRLWVQDEHRYGLISTLRRCWSLRGIRPKAPCQTKYEWGYVYGALEVMTGASEFFYTPGVNLEWSAAFLKQVSEREPDAEHVVIWDGAGFHQKNQLGQVPDNIHLINLPPYSPELNPIEQLWDQVGVVYANKVYETLEAIEEDITYALTPFIESAKPVLSLLGADNYLLSSANDT